MKKMIFCTASALMMAICINAQTINTPTPPTPEVKAGMKDLRKDLRDVKKDRRQFRKEKQEGDMASAKAIGKDIREDNREIHKDAGALKEQGVKNPIKRAERQIHRKH